jgi:hypothetical protein
MLKADAMLGWASGFTAEGPMFWTLLVLLACLVYLRSTQIVAERQAKLEAENARRQEQTYQAMVQHYRQVVNEQQARMETAGQRPPAAPAARWSCFNCWRKAARRSPPGWRPAWTRSPRSWRPCAGSWPRRPP